MLVSRQHTDLSKNNSNDSICSLAYGTKTNQAAVERRAWRYVKAVLSLCVYLREIEFRVLSVCLREWLSSVEA